MINFYTYQLIKIFFTILMFDATIIKSADSINTKSINDDANLYSKFNKRLSKVSSFVKNNMDVMSAPYLDKLFKTNNEIISEQNIVKNNRNMPKKTHNYYDFNSNNMDTFAEEKSDNTEARGDDTESISKNLNRLIEILGTKHKNKNGGKGDDKDEDHVVRINGGINMGEDNDDDDNDSSNDEPKLSNDDSVDQNKAMVDIKLEKPVYEPTIIKTDRGNPNDDDIKNWVEENPDKFHTFVHAMYVMRNKDNKKIKNEISCLIYCDRLDAEGDLVGEANQKRCVCRDRKKRLPAFKTNLKFRDVSSLSKHNIVKRAKEASTTPSLSSSSAVSSTKDENVAKSSGNLLKIYENEKTEDKKPMDEDKFNENQIESTKKQPRGNPVVNRAIDIIAALPPLERVPKCESCSNLLNTQCNATGVLDRVLTELDELKADREKSSRDCVDGKPCNVTGSWNSQVVGMQFNINTSCGGGHDLSVGIADHYPPKRECLMDANWTLVGYTLHINGGPFYMAATRSKEEILATFTGMCRTCTGADTIFGTWNFIRPAKDCRDLLMAVDVRRDVFHKSTLHAKVMEKQKEIKEKKDEAAEVEDEYS